MTRRGSRWGLGICVTWAIVLPASAVVPDDPPQGVFDDGWYVVKMQDRKSGYMHSTTRRIGDEIHTQVNMQIEIARGSSTVKIRQDQSYRETLSGMPLAFRHTTTMGSMPVTRTGTVKDGRLTLDTDQVGGRRVETYDFDPEVRFAWGQLLEQRKHGLTPGSSFRVKIYEPDLKLDGPVDVVYTVHDKQSIDVLGHQRKLTRVTTTMQLAIPLASESWVDDDATPIVTTIDMGIISVQMFRSTEAEALKDSEAPEMFLRLFVSAQQRIDADARRVRLRLTLPDDAEALPSLPSTGMQTVQRISDHEAILTIRRLDWDAIRKVQDGEKTDASLAAYLQSSAILNTADRRIRRLARRGTRDAATPADKADALRRFVTKYVKNKSLDIGFATASEVAKTREGDCTEHGVLLAALARAAGLPARGVSGIVAVPQGPLAPAHGTTFGYHMWTQVNIGGEWVDIDAAMRQTDCDPTHIAIALMPLNQEGMVDSVLSLLPLLGKLQIEVLSVN